MASEVGLGVAVAAAALYLTFFGTAGTVEVATLLVAVAAFIWVAAVEPARLVDAAGRPRTLLFGLGGLALALVLTSVAVLGTGTALLLLLVTVAAVGVGLVRAIRFGMPAAPATPPDDR
jgi:hypothetical protein